MSYEKYGKEHQDAKKKRLEKTNGHCELSGEKPNDPSKIHAHHIHPLYLNVHGEGAQEFEYNYMILTEQYHKYIHDITRSDAEEGKMVRKRLQVAKEVWKDPSDKEKMAQLKEYDDVLIPEFINKMLDNCRHSIRELLVNKTLVAFIHTNRDLKVSLRERDIKKAEQDAEIDRLKKELDELKSKIILEQDKVKTDAENEKNTVQDGEKIVNFSKYSQQLKYE